MKDPKITNLNNSTNPIKVEVFFQQDYHIDQIIKRANQYFDEYFEKKLIDKDFITNEIYIKSKKKFVDTIINHIKASHHVDEIELNDYPEDTFNLKIVGNPEVAYKIVKGIKVNIDILGDVLKSYMDTTSHIYLDLLKTSNLEKMAVLLTYKTEEEKGNKRKKTLHDYLDEFYGTEIYIKHYSNKKNVELLKPYKNWFRNKYGKPHADSSITPAISKTRNNI